MTVTILKDSVKVTVNCTVTGEIYILILPLEGWKKWQDGENIQAVFPLLSPNEREMLISGITPAEWNQMFNS